MQDEIGIELEQLVDRFVQKGHAAPDIIAAFQEELYRLTTSYQQDPDPADDPKEIDEPANDWPSA
ncbi:hypothetical protein ACUTJJ_05490 [Agrobacterium sp. DKPNP3]|uniref:hypothetical protein n=1 Tax=Agrobacterium sp. DKPNP3 TaxID=3457323 RepID=UPI0040445496